MNSSYFQGMNQPNGRVAQFVSLLILIMIIGPSLHSLAQSGVPTNAVELRAGLDMSGHPNITLDVLEPVPVGGLCEIRNSTNDEVLKTFYIGHGTEGPPTVFKDGQFDYLMTVSPDPHVSKTLSVYIRVYDAPTVASATRYGDSPVMTIVGGNMYNLDGWALNQMQVTDSGDNDDPGTGDINDSNDVNDRPWWKNPLFLAIICALVVLIIGYTIIEGQTKAKKGKGRKKASKQNKKGKK